MNVQSSSVIVLLADGARPDTLTRAIDDGTLPALARLRTEGAMYTVSSVFPSVTGPAYTPFLVGRYPGPVGLPGLRWFDRTRRTVRGLGGCRSYVGAELRHVDTDLDASSPTMFELAPSLGALSVIRRGLAPRECIGRGARFAARAARTHFRGNVAGWLDMDRDVATQVARRVREQQPRFVFAAFTGIDKASHATGHDSDLVRDAMRIVDDAAATIRREAERDGRWETMHLWVASDHGHSAVGAHDDLAAVLRSWGIATRAHPWAFAGGDDAAVMVSGNAMAHIYLELDRNARPWWPALSDRWSELASRLLERESVDCLMLPHSPCVVEVVSRTGGSALIVESDGRLSYRPSTGDPLGIGAHEMLTDDEAYDVCVASDYPDALVQIARLATSPRSGEMMLSAARSWDFRARYEPIPHVSSHGALHREHMMVPLLTNRRAIRAPRRTVDVMPTALAVLGLPAPPGLDGRSFVTESTPESSPAARLGLAHGRTDDDRDVESAVA